MNKILTLIDDRVPQDLVHAQPKAVAF